MGWRWSRRTRLRWPRPGPRGLRRCHGPARRPHFISATSRQAAQAGTTAEEAARWHLRRFLSSQGSTDATLGSAALVHVHDLGPAGKIVQALRQHVGNVEVYPGEIKVLLRQNRAGLHLRRPGTGDAGRPRRVPPAPQGGPDQVPVAPLWHLDRPGGRDRHRRQRRRRRLASLPARRACPSTLRAGPRQADLLPPGPAPGASLLRRVLRRPDRQTDSDAYRYLIAADDGRMLERIDLTARDAFTYRVWADHGDLRPLEGPFPTSRRTRPACPTGSYPAFVAPTLITMEGFNTNPHGGRSVAAAPARRRRRQQRRRLHRLDDAARRLLAGDIRATVTSRRHLRSHLRRHRRPQSSASRGGRRSPRSSTSRTGCTTGGTTPASTRRPATPRRTTTGAAASGATRSTPRRRTARAASATTPT